MAALGALSPTSQTSVVRAPRMASRPIMSNAEFLASIDLFSDLPADLMLLVAELFEEQEFENDAFVFRASDPSRHVFVVKTGGVVLFSDTVGQAIELKARLGPGAVFGEVGVLQGSGRTLSARASGATLLLRLEGHSLLELASAYEELAFRLSKIALGYSFENLSARAELARRKEARVRLGAPIEVRVEGCDPRPAVLENLSLGGACLSGLTAWNLDEARLVSFSIDRDRSLLSFHGRVAWRRRDRLGIAFTRTFPDHEIRVAGALHRLTKVLLATPV